MERYKKDLGVACSYCHVENRETGKLDYAPDENPKKHIARIMIAMLDDINDRHLPSERAFWNAAMTATFPSRRAVPMSSASSASTAVPLLPRMNSCR